MPSSRGWSSGQQRPASSCRLIPTCNARPAATRWPTEATTPAPFRCGSGIGFAGVGASTTTGLLQQLRQPHPITSVWWDRRREMAGGTTSRTTLSRPEYLVPDCPSRQPSPMKSRGCVSGPSAYPGPTLVARNCGSGVNVVNHHPISAERASSRIEELDARGGLGIPLANHQSIYLVDRGWRCGRRIVFRAEWFRSRAIIDVPKFSASRLAACLSGAIHRPGPSDESYPALD
jgi:hypothetical protein